MVLLSTEQYKARRAAGTAMNYLGLCAIAKDETPYLREWVAYHHLIGVEKIIIYDNESQTPIAETLSDFVQTGLVQVRPVVGKSLQRAAYTDCIRRDRDNFFWLGFLDIDEFFVLKKHKDLRLFLSDYDDCCGVALHWRMFSSSGHVGRPGGLVLENFTEYMPNDPTRVHVKCLVRPDMVTRVVDPHTFEFKDQGFCVDENRFPVMSAIGPYSDNLAFVNHYYFKSQQEFEEKITRGRSDAFELGVNRKIQTFYDHTAARMAVSRMNTGLLKAVQLILSTGHLVRLVDVNTTDFQHKPLFQLTDFVTACLEQGEPEPAMAVMASLRKKYVNTPEFVQLDFLSLLAGRNFAAAETRLLKLITLQPALEHYFQLYLLWAQSGRYRDAELLKEYIRQAAVMYGLKDHPVLTKLRARELESRLARYQDSDRRRDAQTSD